jgi:hypothetical protein
MSADRTPAWEADSDLPEPTTRVEERSGHGELLRGGELICRVRYHIKRSQPTLGGSGLPVPGSQRIDGSIDGISAATSAHLIGVPLTLRMEDGHAFGVTLVDAAGRIRSEARTHVGCSCC